jgi:hypothetical protein
VPVQFSAEIGRKYCGNIRRWTRTGCLIPFRLAFIIDQISENLAEKSNRDRSSRAHEKTPIHADCVGMRIV